MSGINESAQGAEIPKRMSYMGMSVSTPPLESSSMGIDLEDVIGYDALWESMERCRRGVIWKGSAAYFCMNAPEEIAKLYTELHDGTYTPRPPVHFKIKRPKPRDIIGIPFRDRVVQRSFNDNVIYPCMSRDWIYDNYACQIGKGTDFARDRMVLHLQRFYRKHGLNGYILKADIKGYYKSLVYDILFKNFRRKCPAFAADFVEYTVRAQYTLSGSYTDRGVNPGSHLIQIGGIDYLNCIDHYIKEDLKIRQYGRYMDDFFLMNESYDYLVYCQTCISHRLAEIGLCFHPTKTRIQPISERFDFLGFNTVLLPSGKVLRTVKGHSIRETKRRVGKIHEVEMRDGRSGEATEASYYGWREYASKGDSYLLLKDMDEWYTVLVEDDYACN